MTDFYQGISGVFRPTDGNLYALPRMHGVADFAPIARYEGSTNPAISPMFNAGTTYQRNTSIDDKVKQIGIKTADQSPQYFTTTNFMQYLQ